MNDTRAPRETQIGLTLCFVGVIASTYGFGVYLFPTLAPDMRADLRLDNRFVGLVSALSQGGLMVAALLAGVFSQRIGLLKTVILSQFIASACMVAIYFTPSRATLLPILTVAGLCAAAAWVPMVPMVQGLVPKARQGLTLGVLASGTAYGVFLNGVLSSTIVPTLGWRLLWLIVGGVGLLIALLTCVLLAGLANFRPEDDSSKVDGNENSIGKPQTLRFFVLLVTFLNGLAFLPFQTYLTSYFRDFHSWSLSSAASLWSAIGMGGMMGGILFGLLGDRIGIKWALALAYAALLVAVVVALMLPDYGVVLASSFLFGLAYNAVFGLMAAYVSVTMISRHATFVSGLSFGALGLGSMIGNYLGGEIVLEVTRYPMLYGAVVALVSVNLFAVLLMPNDRAAA